MREKRQHVVSQSKDSLIDDLSDFAWQAKSFDVQCISDCSALVFCSMSNVTAVSLRSWWPVKRRIRTKNWKTTFARWTNPAAVRRRRRSTSSSSRSFHRWRKVRRATHECRRFRPTTPSSWSFTPRRSSNRRFLPCRKWPMSVWKSWKKTKPTSRRWLTKLLSKHIISSTMINSSKSIRSRSTTRIWRFLLLLLLDDLCNASNSLQNDKIDRRWKGDVNVTLSIVWSFRPEKKFLNQMAELMKKKHQLRLIELEESVLAAQVIVVPSRTDRAEEDISSNKNTTRPFSREIS